MTHRYLIRRHSTADSNQVSASLRPGGQPNGPPSRPIVMKGRVLKTMLRVQPRPRNRTRSMVFANLEAKEGVQKGRALKLPGPLALSWSIRYVPRTSYRTFSRNLTVAPPSQIQPSVIWTFCVLTPRIQFRALRVLPSRIPHAST